MVMVVRTHCAFCNFDDHYLIPSHTFAQFLGNLRKKLSVLKDMNPTEDIIKPAIIEAISQELKNSTDIGLITNELSCMQQEELISPELLTWATAETQREHRHMLEISVDDYDQLVMMCPPVELNHDDLYHASLCSTVVNTSSDTEQCKKLLQSLSYKSLKELSLSQPTDVATLPKCMIAISESDGGGATTYVAFENVVDYTAWKLYDDDQKASFGKGTIAHLLTVLQFEFYFPQIHAVLECQIEKFPTLYFETIIKREERLVLTGRLEIQQTDLIIIISLNSFLQDFPLVVYWPRW